MSTKNFFEQWMKPTMANSMPSIPGMTPAFDMKAVMEANRKTLRTFTEMQQLAVESMQTIAQRQAEILTQMVQDQSEIARGIITDGTPEEKVARGAEMVKRAYEKTVSGMREVGDIMNKSNREATDILNERVATALEEISTTIEEQVVARQEDIKKAAKKAA